MATKVTMEALSPTMEEGRLVKWLKNEGDQVAKGDVLAEVETDKAVMELTARGDGVLRARLAAEGDTRPVGELLAVIGAPDENIDALGEEGARGRGHAIGAVVAAQPGAAGAASAGGAAAPAARPRAAGIHALPPATVADARAHRRSRAVSRASAGSISVSSTAVAPADASSAATLRPPRAASPARASPPGARPRTRGAAYHRRRRLRGHSAHADPQDDRAAPRRVERARFRPSSSPPTSISRVSASCARA